MNTTRMCKLKCWYSRVNIVSFEIERRSNGSLKIKSIVTGRGYLWGRTRHENIACYINVIFQRHFQRASLQIVHIFIDIIESAVARHSCYKIRLLYCPDRFINSCAEACVAYISDCYKQPPNVFNEEKASVRGNSRIEARVRVRHDHYYRMKFMRIM